MILLNPHVGWYARLKSYFQQKYPVKTKNLEQQAELNVKIVLIKTISIP